MKLEFQRSHDQVDILVVDKEDNTMSIFSENNEQIICSVLRVIKSDYPEAYSALLREYGSIFNGRFLMVRRFIKCNMSVGDHILDFDGEDFNFEDVTCPMRGECTWDGIICRPQYNSELSKCELEVAKLVGLGVSDIQISDSLHKSLFTVANHIKHIYKKLKMNNRTQLALWANRNYPVTKEQFSI